MKKILYSILAFGLVVSIASCRKELPIKTVDPTDPNLNLLELNIPENFNYETSQEVTISISGFKSSQTNKVKYDIYLYNADGKTETFTTMGDGGEAVNQTIQNADAMSGLAASYITDATSFDVKITIPAFYNSIYVMKNDMGVYSSLLLPVNSNKLSAVFVNDKASFKSNKDVNYTVDMIYGVNGASELYKIDTETGALTIVSLIPAGNGGSYTCAIDPFGKILYAIGLNSPYNLLAYNIIAGTWSTKGSTGIFGPRLAYNIFDGFLYYSYNDKIIIIDPSNAKTIMTYTVNKLNSLDGGDISFSADGTIYMSTTSGIYKLKPKKNNRYDADLISNTLPSYASSLAFGYDNTLWWASNVNGKGQIYTFDLNTRNVTSYFSPFNHLIDDIALLPVDIAFNDVDNDGIIDLYDEYPSDPVRATTTYTPSLTGLGSYAFEDLWPSKGDYDFNDLIVNYSYANVLNGEGFVIETRMYFYVKNLGGSFHNGFGLELDMDESLIKEVTGFNLTEGFISLNGKGLENNQTKPVIIVFDNSHKNYDANSNVLQILISYNYPIQPELIGAFNPFIFVNGERGKEVHMANNSPTTLANTAYFGTFDDASLISAGSYYKNSNNLPWAINILYDFTFLQEKSAINQGYPKFALWAVSGGVDYTDWFKDIDDYRDYTYLVADE